jgi:PAS domain S-box-containing protein
MDKIKILYVDDEQRNISSFKGAFRREFKIDTAISAEEGKKLMAENEYHILLTDQRMPKISGVEFLTEMCDLHPDVMRILITAYSDIEAVINAINHGKIYKYVNKPYDENELRKIFEEAYQVYQYRKGVNANVNKYKETFERSNDPIFLINTKGEFIDANQACLQLFGMDRSELLRTPCSYFFKEKDEKKSFMRKLQQSDEVEDFEVAIKARSSVADCLMSIRKIKFDFDDSIAYHGSLKNITFIKEATNSLIKDIVVQQEEERYKFAEILHESLAQKLAGMKFYMASLRDKDKNQALNERVVVEASSVLDRAIEELREVCIDLVPQSINKGLNVALEEVIQRIENNYSVYISRDLFDVHLERQNSVVAFRVTQEIILELIEKNQVKKLHVELGQDSEGTMIEIRFPKVQDLHELINHIRPKVVSFKGSIKVVDGRENQSRIQVNFIP